MGPLEYAWGVSLLATAWLLPVGAIRMIAYASGEVDHTPGMRNVAIFALSAAVVFAITLVVLTIVMVNR